MKYVIRDWANNPIHFKNRPFYYDSFDDAEEVLSEELDDNYETDRQEYYIIEEEN
jgi:hypothetical protein